MTKFSFASQGSNSKFYTFSSAGSDRSQILLCDMKTGASTHILAGHEKAVKSVMWSPLDEYVLASAR